MVAVSSSTIRSSTSFCLIAADASRKVARARLFAGFHRYLDVVENALPCLTHGTDTPEFTAKEVTSKGFSSERVHRPDWPVTLPRREQFSKAARVEQILLTASSDGA